MYRYKDLFLIVIFIIPIRVIEARFDEEEEEKAIYLVMVGGEPLAFKKVLNMTYMQQGWLHQHSKLYEAHKKQVVQFHDQLLGSTVEDGSYIKLCSFHHIVNGFAVHTTPSQIEKLRLHPKVVMVEKDSGAKLMTTYAPQLLGLPDDVWPPRRDGEDVDGEGVVVGVVDTGIDPAHPSFAYVPSDHGAPLAAAAAAVCSVGTMFPPGSCNGKIVTARYFAAGASAALRLNGSRDLSPFDADGHGSHVASIAAGNHGVPVVVNGAMYGFASGMAPAARLAVYKAIYPAGGTIADLVSAIDQATQDNVDVLVLSVGPDEPPDGEVTFLSILDVALLFARRAGVFVAQAAGNGGPAGSSVVSYSPWVITVAAGTTGRKYTPWLALGDGRQVPGVGLSAPTAGDGLIQLRLVAAMDAVASEFTGCNSTVPNLQGVEECQGTAVLRPAAAALRGSVVICSFSDGFYNGTSTVTAVVETARALGFAGFVLVAGAQYGDFLAQPLSFAVPGVMVPRLADAQVIWSYYEKHTYRAARSSTVFGAAAAITEGRAATFTDGASVVARYSSRGPDIIDRAATPADVLKPDILAPGDQIWAAWSPLSANEPILAGNHFALISGTSMAAPHIAGIATLIRQRHPSWAPSVVASALSTTAWRHDKRGSLIMSQGLDLDSLHPATPFDYGAGFVNPTGALDPGLVLASEFNHYISFLCSLPQLSPGDVGAATGVACETPLNSPADLNLPSITVSALQGSLSVRRRVTNMASEAETYLCSVRPPEGVDAAVQPRWFEIPPGGTQEMVIKFNVTKASDSFSFGEIVLTGSLEHLVRLPLAVRPLAT